MERTTIYRLGAIAPIVLSLAAFGIASMAGVLGWGRGPDEGTPAHLFHLSLAAEVPFVAALLITADRRRAGRVAILVGVQACAAVLAFVPVAFFKL